MPLYQFCRRSLSGVKRMHRLGFSFDFAQLAGDVEQLHLLFTPYTLTPYALTPFTHHSLLAHLLQSTHAINASKAENAEPIPHPSARNYYSRRRNNGSQ